ncbi:MAG: VWA domain-containing protein, partial [Deltaproteobacteria bacterium]|nr:VWA domain-containing protein [Deltaproteobacteria bacterium]
MSFLNPLMLLGLLAAAVPIVIHLIHKRRPRPQYFGAIELVLRSVERVERRWRLRRLLLLLSRVALLAMLALAAAGPLLGREAERGTSSAGPERLAIVLDGSLSMRARYGGTSSFARALTAARNLVDRMGPEDQAVLVLAGRPNRLLVDRPTPDRGQLLRLLDSLEPGYGPAELGEAVSTAVTALGTPKDAAPEGEGEAPEVAARVVVLSDLAQHAFQSAAALDVPGTRSKARVEVVDVLEEAAKVRANHAIARAEAVNVPGEAPRTVEVRARVQSFSTEGGGAQPLDITLRSQERDLEAGSVDVVPGTIVDKALRHAFDRPGHIPVTVALEPDALAEDDVRHVVVEVRRPVRTLIVDGAPSGVPKEDEVFYLERALLAGAADQPPPRVITADDLSRTDLAAFDVVMLAGVATFTRADGARLAEHVERGGGLFISATEGLDVDLYNAELGAVLPRTLRGMKIVDA